MNIIRRLLLFILETVESVTFALTFTVLGYLFLAQPMIVQGASSYPNLITGERIMIDKITPHWQDYQRGEFVIPESPANPDVTFIKRVIGLPGERIKISQCHIYINGMTLEEQYLDNDSCTTGGQWLAENQEIAIPDGYYFLMGDNREHSSDSRDFGPMAKGKIVGRAWLRFWPPDRFGLLNQTE